MHGPAPQSPMQSWSFTGDNIGNILTVRCNVRLRPTQTVRSCSPDVSSEVSFDRSWLNAVLGTVTLLGYYPANYDYIVTVYAPGFALVAPSQANTDPPGLTYMLVNPIGKETGA